MRASLSCLLGFAAAEWVVQTPGVSQISLGFDFATPDVGYLSGLSSGQAGSQVKKTEDGGDTWLGQPVGGSTPFMPFGVAALSEFSAVQSGMGGLGPFNGAIYTSDGQSWNTSQTSSGGLIEVELYVDATPSLDGNVFVLAGEWDSPIEGRGRGVAISSNGGQNFGRFAHNFGGSNFASFINATHGVVTGSNSALEAANPLVFGEGKGEVHMNGVVVRTDQDVSGRVVQDSGNTRGFITKTTDGGATWYMTYNTDNYGMYPIQMVNAEVGYAAGRSAQGSSDVLKTSDGGETWQIVYSVSGREPYALHCVDPLYCWVSGVLSSGPALWFLETRDGGNTWVMHDDTGLRGVPSAIVGADANSLKCVTNSISSATLLQYI